MSATDVEVDAGHSDADAEFSGRSRIIAALVALLSLAGIGVAGYLTYVHWFHKPIVCAGLHSCAEVALSPYAWIAGIPVAFLGLLGYVALLAIALFWLVVRDRFDIWPLLAIWGMSLGGVAYSAYLTYVELYVIHAVCIWCVSSAVIMVLVCIVATAGLLTLWRDSELLSGSG